MDIEEIAVATELNSASFPCIWHAGDSLWKGGNVWLLRLFWDILVLPLVSVGFQQN